MTNVSRGPAAAIGRIVGGGGLTTLGLVGVILLGRTTNSTPKP